MSTEHPAKAFGCAARDPSGVLSPFNFSRRATGDEDVRFKILYCGICHSDLHCVKNEWDISKYPLVPGHEIVGVVTEVGSKVQKFKVGDKVGVGCMVGACHSCDSCKNDLENYCPKVILIYNSIYYDGTMTYGGYSDHMVATECYVVRIPDNLPLDTCTPLICAGITTYRPLRYFGLDKPGLNFGVKKEAIEHLGADSFLISTDPNEMQAATGTLDGIIDTISIVHSLLPLLGLLKSHGKLVLVGAPEKPFELPAFPLLMVYSNNIDS
ncbi:putative mannitol dehydrogenase [Camellia lanceoleosa]|uniref:Mannitol dehydrogenase n=1 Tax=Camellia lanceoleosa TaxID=1840588 RepID=A0ACC0HXS6_9ERIC|nr:putative mannitol dehydrogenase [Camellia lanceoleosa]